MFDHGLTGYDSVIHVVYVSNITYLNNWHALILRMHLTCLTITFQFFCNICLRYCFCVCVSCMCKYICL